jgi:hypothetical protein
MPTWSTCWVCCHVLFGRSWRINCWSRTLTEFICYYRMLDLQPTTLDQHTSTYLKIITYHRRNRQHTHGNIGTESTKLQVYNSRNYIIIQVEHGKCFDGHGNYQNRHSKCLNVYMNISNVPMDMDMSSLACLAAHKTFTMHWLIYILYGVFQFFRNLWSLIFWSFDPFDPLSCLVLANCIYARRPSLPFAKHFRHVFGVYTIRLVVRFQCPEKFDGCSTHVALVWCHTWSLVLYMVISVRHGYWCDVIHGYWCQTW